MKLPDDSPGERAWTTTEARGADIIAYRRVIEVETATTVRDGLRQLQGYRKPVYISGADTAATEAAMEATEGTTVGVMDSDGKIVKPSSSPWKKWVPSG